MKVVIQQPNPPKKTYTNLPERDESHLRSRLGEPSVHEQPVEKAPLVEPTPEVEVEHEEMRRSKNVSRLFRHRSHQEQIPIEEQVAVGDYRFEEPVGEELVEEEHVSWKTSRWVPALLVTAVILLGGVGYIATHFESDQPLERITVEGAHMLSTKEVVDLAGINRKTKFYSLDLKAIAKNLERHSLVMKAYPRREVGPNTIVLRVEERQPVAMVRSESTGEALLIDKEGVVLRPKLMAGLRDPEKLLQVPLLSGVRDKDTAGFLAMTKLVAAISSFDSGTLLSAMGEVHRTPTGAYVLYTVETQTPIFIGAPGDVEFRTALETEREAPSAKPKESLFYRQIRLLAHVWKTKLHDDVRSQHPLYVDARFAGQILLKQGTAHSGSHAPTTAQQSVQSPSNQSDSAQHHSTLSTSHAL